MAFSGSASVIVGTYNDLDILETSLAALAVQSFHDFEVVLADDGSSQEYAPILKTWAPRFVHGIAHATHDKKGFRKARILNRAIQSSRFSRLIVLDMDCLPHRDFIRNHQFYAEPRTAIDGRRAHISRDVVPTPAQILENGLGFTPIKLAELWMRGKARVIEHGVHLPFFYSSSNTNFLGSNFSVWRDDLINVNGFNEEFEGWGKEDADLGLRLQHSGVRIRNLRNRVIQYHLMHEKLPSRNPASDTLFARTESEKIVRARAGIDEIRAGDFKLTRYGGSGAQAERATSSKSSSLPTPP